MGLVEKMSNPLESGLLVLNEVLVAGDPQQQLAATKCRALLAGYAEKWQEYDTSVEVLSVEELVTAGLYNPSTQSSSRTFTLAGKIDVIERRSGKRVIIDHKTTSADIEDPNSPYWRQLVVEAQPSHYMLLEWLNGRKVDECVWDVIRKPNIRPSKITRKEMEDILFRKQYYGRSLSEQSTEEVQGTGLETLEMYESRLLHDCSNARPAYYFQRRTVARIDREIHEHAEEMWDYSQEIILARRLNRHLRNSGACMLYGTPCKFLGICSGHDDVESGNWTKKNSVHQELDGLNGDGRDVLTNSRMSDFKTCRRRHYFDYELGIKRTDEEDSEALYIGTLLHKALECYFKSIKENNNGRNHDAVPATEVGTSREATL